MYANPYKLMIRKKNAAIWLIRISGEGAIASLTKMEIDVPTTKLQASII